MNRVRLGSLIAAGAITAGAMVTIAAPAANASPSGDCVRNGGVYEFTRVGSHTYASCTVGDKVIAWTDGKTRLCIRKNLPPKPDDGQSAPYVHWT
jgi:hypothetical protein